MTDLWRYQFNKPWKTDKSEKKRLFGNQESKVINYTLLEFAPGYRIKFTHNYTKDGGEIFIYNIGTLNKAFLQEIAENVQKIPNCTVLHCEGLDETQIIYTETIPDIIQRRHLLSLTSPMISHGIQYYGFKTWYNIKDFEKALKARSDDEKGCVIMS